jgi:hypothetical protein
MTFSALFLPEISIQGCKCPAVRKNLVIGAQDIVVLATYTLFLHLGQHSVMCGPVHIFHHQKLCALTANTRPAPEFKWALPTWHVMRRHFFQNENESDVDRI